MTQDTRTPAPTTEQIERAATMLRRHLARLEELFAGRELEQPFYLQGISGLGHSDTGIESAAWVAAAGRSCLAQIDRMNDPIVFRPMVIEYSPYGVHFVDRILGARVRYVEGQWWTDPIDGPIGELRPPDLSRNATWQYAKRAGRAFLRHNPPLVTFSLPTIASSLNIGVNLYGERLLAALLEQPEAAARDLATINDVLRKLHGWFRTRIPADRLQPVVGAQRFMPPGRGQICGCSTHLLSAETYRRIVAPLDALLLRSYPRPGMIHLCGSHTQHIPTWRDMEHLGAVQLNDQATDELPAYVNGLRPDQVIYVVPTAKTPAREALRIAGRHPIVIIGEPDNPES
jgi:hypothetical protein